jgi:hypothetical protein
VYKDNFGVYGIEEVWRQLNREGVRGGRNRVARLMRELGLEGWSAVSGSGRRSPLISTSVRMISSTGTSGRRRRTGSGSRTW